MMRRIFLLAALAAGVALVGQAAAADVPPKGAKAAYKKLLEQYAALIARAKDIQDSKDPATMREFDRLLKEAQGVKRRLEELKPLAEAPALGATELRAAMPGLSKDRAEAMLPVLNRAMDEFDILTPRRRAAFLAQVAAETGGLKRLAEGFNYTAERLLAVFPKKFTKEEAKTFAKQPEKIANRVYAGRFGNGNEASGDGWRYRGRGMLQITFRANYKAAGKALGIDLEAHPEKVEEAEVAARTAGWFWRSKGLNELADKRDIKAITRRVKGNLDTLKEREANYRRALKALGAEDPAK